MKVSGKLYYWKKLYLWKQYRDLVNIFIRLVDEDRGNKNCLGDPRGVDDDTPYAQELFEKLCDVSFFIHGHIKDLEREEKKSRGV